MQRNPISAQNSSRAVSGVRVRGRATAANDEQHRARVGIALGVALSLPIWVIAGFFTFLLR